MDKITHILNSQIELVKIEIENFTILNSEIKITLIVNSVEFGSNIILCKGVSKLDIDSNYYTCPKQLSIVIEDISILQWENVTYKVSISEDIMTFNCQVIELE